MRFEPPLQEGRLLRRYKRFLADVRLPDGNCTTLHCPNTGSMRNCLVAESPCWFSRSDNPKRKYPYTWEVATTNRGHLAGINTGRANALVEEALREQRIAELAGYSQLRREVRYGEERSRIDFLLTFNSGPCYVEVKNVTLFDSPAGGEARGYFPDAVSERGCKHLRELAQIARQGHRAVLFYCVQHTGVEDVAPADHIDVRYGEAFRAAVEAGVEVIAYRADITPREIVLRHPVAVALDR